ncbi:MAG: glycosyltransferase family 39 protein [Blastocatellia bacterium]|nr:glycosyltransferase family 39 protein [Blastocatellia bacterium]
MQKDSPSKLLHWQAWFYRHLPFITVLLLFTVFQCYNLDRFPAPRCDEPWLMQPSLQLINKGEPGLPMFRRLGGNIEHYWLTSPVQFWSLAIFFKLFGFGLLQARLFNLLMSLLVLLSIYLIMSHLFSHRVGALTALLLSIDGNYIYWTKIYRSDFPVAACCFLTLLLVLKAKGKVLNWFTIGFLTAAGLLIHPNALLLLGLVPMWVLIGEDRKRILSRCLPSCIFGFLLLFSPFLYKVSKHWPEFVAQWSSNQTRLRAASGSGLWLNFISEWERFLRWPKAWSLLGSPIPPWLVGLIALLILICIASLLFQRFHKESLYLLTGLFATAVFLALTDSRKVGYYLPLLSPWIAGVVALQMSRFIDWMKEGWKVWRSLARLSAVTSCSIVGLGFCLIVWNMATIVSKASTKIPISETALELQKIVPKDAIISGRTIYWLAFAQVADMSEKYLVFHKEIVCNGRLREGKPLVLIVDEKGIGRRRFFKKFSKKHPELLEKIGEILASCYGKLEIFLVKECHLPTA